MEKEIVAILKHEPKTNLELRRALNLSADSYDPKLDRTLQKLRKTGKLKLIGSRWTVESFAICPHCKGRGYVRKHRTVRAK